MGIMIYIFNIILKMDHRIEQLDACVFDYLASNPNELKSFIQIYNNISGPTGHRCSQLQDLSNRQKYKDMFMTICYTLDNKWENIHKIYTSDIPHLIFSNKPRSEVIAEYNSAIYDSSNYDQVDQFELDSVIDYILNDTKQYKFDFSLQMGVDGNLLQYLVKKNKLSKLKQMLDLYDVDLNNKFDGKTLLDTAVENGYAEMVKELMEQNFNNKTNDLNIKIKELKQLNTKLQNEKQTLALQNATMQNEKQTLALQNTTIQSETQTVALQNATLRNDLNRYSSSNSFLKMVTLFLGMAAFILFLN